MLLLLLLFLASSSSSSSSSSSVALAPYSPPSTLSTLWDYLLGSLTGALHAVGSVVPLRGMVSENGFPKKRFLKKKNSRKKLIFFLKKIRKIFF